MEKDWPKRPSDRQLLGARKKTLIGHNLKQRQSVSCTLGATRVPTSQAAALPSRSTLIEAELPQTKESCVYAHKIASVVSSSAAL